jgi:ribosomal protein S12 methylthiotransferase accessory factor
VEYLKRSRRAGYGMYRLEGGSLSKIASTLEKAKRLVSEETGIIKRLLEIPIDPDEPNIVHYVAELTDISFFSSQSPPQSCGGAALTRNLAIVRARGEALERYCLSIYDLGNLVHGSLKELKGDAMDPRRFVLFSETQYSRENFPFSRFSENAKMNWIWGYSLTEKRPVLVPACFAFVTYNFTIPEEFITVPISTGAACGDTTEEAILKGIYEVVERDAFMIMWLNKLSLPQLLLSSDEISSFSLLQHALDRFSNTNLELHINHITLDIRIPTFLTTIVDRSGKGPAVAIGSASNVNPELAAVKSIIEAAQTRLAVKQLMQLEKSRKQGQKVHMKLTGGDKWLLFYSKLDKLPKMKFVTQSPMIDIGKTMGMSSDSTQLKSILELFREKNLEVIAVDITTPDISEVGFHVVKVLVTEMQPLHFYPFYHLGGRRLYEVPYNLGLKHDSEKMKMHIYPHPFP